VRVELPIDHLRELWPEKFRGARVGALLHPASVSAKLEHSSHILEQQNGDLFRLAAFFGPQHGFRGETETIDKMEKRVELDLAYINNWSLWLDIKILIKTPFTLLSKNIY
jgi:uncharacterized protein YbbC (DUF1343 family)